MSAALSIRPVSTRRELRQFIHLPAQIHEGHKNWVPPVYMDDRKYFDLKKNRSATYCDAVLLLAYRGDKVVGRIMGIIHHRYNQFRGEQTGRFAYLECRDEQDIAHLLLNSVEQWAKTKGMRKMVGPLGFNDQDPEGFLIEGFEHPPTVATYYNYPFMIRLLENEGYQKEVDYFVYRLEVPSQIPEFYEKIYRRAERRENIQLVEFTSRRQLKAYIEPIFSLMNECFSSLYGFFPLDTAEMKELARKFMPMVDPRFVKIVKKGDEVVAFIIGVPDMTEGIRRSKGHLFPIGLFHILRASRNTSQLDLLLGGIKQPYRSLGLDALLGMKMLEAARRAGYTVIDSHHELESNTEMRAEMERMGGQVYKRYRIFRKDLQPE